MTKRRTPLIEVKSLIGTIEVYDLAITASFNAVLKTMVRNGMDISKVLYDGTLDDIVDDMDVCDDIYYTKEVVKEILRRTYTWNQDENNYDVSEIGVQEIITIMADLKA